MCSKFVIFTVFVKTYGGPPPGSKHVPFLPERNFSFNKQPIM